jgi:hypothetical protein
MDATKKVWTNGRKWMIFTLFPIPILAQYKVSSYMRRYPVIVFTSKVWLNGRNQMFFTVCQCLAKYKLRSYKQRYPTIAITTHQCGSATSKSCVPQVVSRVSHMLANRTRVESFSKVWLHMHCTNLSVNKVHLFSCKKKCFSGFHETLEQTNWWNKQRVDQSCYFE